MVPGIAVHGSAEAAMRLTRRTFHRAPVGLSRRSIRFLQAPTTAGTSPTTENRNEPERETNSSSGAYEL